MPRPKRAPENRRATAIRFPEDLHEELIRAADERGTSVNHLVVKAAEFYLNNLPSLEPRVPA